MVSISKVVCFLALTTAVFAERSARAQPKLPALSRTDEEHFEFHQSHIQSHFDPQRWTTVIFQRQDKYAHLIGAEPQRERELFDITKQRGYGPAHVTYARGHRYVTTKLPSSSTVARRWGLGLTQADEPQATDLFAFWRYNKPNIPKLLRLEAWPVGSNTVQFTDWVRMP